MAYVKHEVIDGRSKLTKALFDEIESGIYAASETADEVLKNVSDLTSTSSEGYTYGTKAYNSTLQISRLVLPYFASDDMEESSEVVATTVNENGWAGSGGYSMKDMYSMCRKFKALPAFYHIKWMARRQSEKYTKHEIRIWRGETTPETLLESVTCLKEQSSTSYYCYMDFLFSNTYSGNIWIETISYDKYIPAITSNWTGHNVDFTYFDMDAAVFLRAAHPENKNFFKGNANQYFPQFDFIMDSIVAPGNAINELIARVTALEGKVK